MRTRMYAAGLIASIALPFGGLFVPESPLLPRTSAETILARADVCWWNDVDWQEMSDDERKAWQTLGWTDQIWESGAPAQPASNSKAWTDLSQDERAAARRLGYTGNSWDADNCKNR